MTVLPFSAVVGHDDVRRALLLGAVDPGLGGVLLSGEKGTAKTTLVRGLAALLPDVLVVKGCRFSCDPSASDPGCPDGPHEPGADAASRPARLVELPLGAGDDRVTGSLDVTRVLAGATTAESFTPGLLAAANRGILYVDEVNLLPDALVDLLLDSAATGRVTVEREGISVRHAARFVLIGTMNPEEGELRPQLLDRFGLSVPVVASHDPLERAAAVRARLGFDLDPGLVGSSHAAAEKSTAAAIVAARAALPKVVLDDDQLLRITRACATLGVDGLRGDLVTSRAAMALAAWDGRSWVTDADVREAARLALPHRRRRGPFDSPTLPPEALEDALGPDESEIEPEPEPEPEPDGPGAGAPASDAGAGPSAGGSDRDGNDSNEAAQQRTAAPSTAAAPDEAFAPRLLQTKRRPGTTAGAAGRRSRGISRTGRPVTTVSDTRAPELLPTLRAAAAEQSARGRTGSALKIRDSDLRRSVRVGRNANLVVVLVDASGSMAARRRTRSVTTAVLSLLTDAYRRRDRVAVLTFRADEVTTIVPPTSSVDVAAARLENVAVGGRTPLVKGLAGAHELIVREGRRDPGRAPLVVVITDGRSTDLDTEIASAAAALVRTGATCVVVDAEEGPVKLGMAGSLAVRLGGECISLPGLAAAHPLTRDRAAADLGQVLRGETTRAA